MKKQINILQLVYPPISNQESEWLKEDDDFKKMLSESNLYMICQRSEMNFAISEAKIKDIQIDHLLWFSIRSATLHADGAIDLGIIAANNGISPIDLSIELGDKIIKIYDNRDQSNPKLVNWFTTDKVLFDKWRKHNAIIGLENYRDLTNYVLHYIGISKEDDSLHRLVIQPHDKRIRILSNEPSFNIGSRLSEEIIFLFFKVNHIRVTIIDEKDGLEKFMETSPSDKKQIIADAEKAFVHLLKSKYNTILFKKYPRGNDGLHSTGLDGYGYVIGEDVHLRTDNDDFRGGYSSDNGLAEIMDVIYVSGDRVDLLKPRFDISDP